jgi:hypothetical protein
MSKCAAWLVSSFSFESKSTVAAEEVSATPKLLAGVVTQPCSREVTSITTNSSSDVGVNDARADPRLGMVSKVTALSLHALVTGETLTEPDASTRLM